MSTAKLVISKDWKPDERSVVKQILETALAQRKQTEEDMGPKIHWEDLFFEDTHVHCEELRGLITLLDHETSAVLEARRSDFKKYLPQ